MTREDAVARAEQLNAEHPDRATHTWIPRQSGTGEWEVAKLRMPGLRRDPLKATTEAKPRPPQPDDPRQAIFRNIPPYGAGG
jgi:hypothetical protein